MKPKAIAKVGKLDVDKLKTVPVNLSKLTYIVDNVVKKKKKIERTSGSVTKAQYNFNKQGL